MSFSKDWWTTGLEDEPCDGCGVRPSKHAGHGSFTCQKCYEARWCPKCKYALHPAPHVCKPPQDRFEKMGFNLWLNDKVQSPQEITELARAQFNLGIEKAAKLIEKAIRDGKPTDHFVARIRALTSIPRVR